MTPAKTQTCPPSPQTFGFNANSWRARSLLLCISLAFASSVQSAKVDQFDWPLGEYVDGQFWPGGNAYVLQHFNNRAEHWFNNRPHAGVDLSHESGGAFTVGASIHASADGVITCVNNEANYPGSVVVIRHTLIDGSERYTQYGHLQPVNTSDIYEGLEVNRGDVIGSVLSWPDDVNNTHLHFEFRTFQDFMPGNCAGPGYAVNDDPVEEGWLNPTKRIFQHRPVGGELRMNTDRLVRSEPSLSGALLGSVPAESTMVYFDVDKDTDENMSEQQFWYQISYNNTAGYINATLAGWSSPLAVAHDDITSAFDGYVQQSLFQADTAYRRIVPTNGDSPLWTSASDWEQWSSYGLPENSTGSVSGKTIFVIDSTKMIEHLWRGNQGYSRALTVNDAVVDFNSGEWVASPSAFQVLPDSNQVTSLGGYYSAGTVGQAMWSDGLGYFRRLPLILAGNPPFIDWLNPVEDWNTDNPIQESQLLGTGRVHSQNGFIVGRTYYQAYWQGDRGYVREIPLNDDNTCCAWSRGAVIATDILPDHVLPKGAESELQASDAFWLPL